MSTRSGRQFKVTMQAEVRPVALQPGMVEMLQMLFEDQQRRDAKLAEEQVA